MVTSLLILGDSALCADHFDRRQAADLDLFLGVGKSLFRESQRLILNAGVFVSVDQVPVHVFNLVHTW